MMQKQSGFSLVEMALVLAIIGILLGGALTGITAQRDSAKYGSSQQSLDQIKEALLTFVLVNKYLPCPDTDGDGYQNPSPRSPGANIACTASRGTVPYMDVGLNQANVRDSWKGNILYAVNIGVTNTANLNDATNSASYFANNVSGSVPVFDLQTAPSEQNAAVNNGRVCNEDAASCNAATANAELAADEVPVVLVAYNKNGIATDANCNNAYSRERENCDGDRFFIQQPITEGVFDDLVQTLSAYEIKAVFLKNNPSALQ